MVPGSYPSIEYSCLPRFVISQKLGGPIDEWVGWYTLFALYLGGSHCPSHDAVDGTLLLELAVLYLRKQVMLFTKSASNRAQSPFTDSVSAPTLWRLQISAASFRYPEHFVPRSPLHPHPVRFFFSDSTFKVVRLITLFDF
jgi:hypothetical protein